MFADLLLRWRPRAAASSRRAAVCPPSTLQGSSASTSGWRSSLRQWLEAGWHSPQPGMAALSPAALQRIRDEFLQTLEDIRTQQAGMLLARISGAGSLRELWHLRPEVFKLVALRYSQAEAQMRVDRLNRHFPARSPRSGFAPLADSRTRRTPAGRG